MCAKCASLFGNLSAGSREFPTQYPNTKPPHTHYTSSWENWASECLSVSLSQCLSISVSWYCLGCCFLLFFFFSSLKMGCRNGGDGGILKQSCLVESDVASAADDWRQKKVDGKCWLARCYDGMMVWWYPTRCPRNESEKPTAKNSIIKFACGHVIWSDCRSKPWIPKIYT